MKQFLPNRKAFRNFSLGKAHSSQPVRTCPNFVGGDVPLPHADTGGGEQREESSGASLVGTSGISRKDSRNRPGKGRRLSRRMRQCGCCLGLLFVPLHRIPPSSDEPAPRGESSLRQRSLCTRQTPSRQPTGRLRVPFSNGSNVAGAGVPSQTPSINRVERLEIPVISTSPCLRQNNCLAEITQVDSSDSPGVPGRSRTIGTAGRFTRLATETEKFPPDRWRHSASTRSQIQRQQGCFSPALLEIH